MARMVAFETRTERGGAGWGMNVGLKEERRSCFHPLSLFKTCARFCVNDRLRIGGIPST